MFSQAITAFFIVTRLVGIPVQAAPTEQYPGFIVLQTDQVANGTLTWYGLDPSANGTAPAEAPQGATAQGCGDNAPVVCSGKHQAPYEACEALNYEFISDPGRGVPTSPRSVCFNGNAGQCCASWARDAPGLLWGYLVNGLEAALGNCGTDSISAKTENVILNGVCTTQCTSNRPTGCT
jgi:hypothetical protein